MPDAEKDARIIKAPPPSHDCRNGLPWDRGGYGCTGLPLGTLGQCGTCGRWWFVAVCGESLGPTDYWRPVRWYHHGLLQRIATSVTPPGGGRA